MVLLIRANAVANDRAYSPKTSAFFRPQRSTTDIMFVVRGLLEFARARKTALLACAIIS